MARVSVLKQIKVDGRWKVVAIPRKQSGAYDWNALPEGRYYLDFWERGKRRKEAAGSTAAEAQEAVRRKKHQLEGRALGVATPEEEERKTLVHVAVKHYLESVEALKKPNTLRKYKAVLDRFVDFLAPNADPRKVSRDDLTDFMVALKKKHQLDNNTVIHQMIIVAQFLKRYGKGGVTKNLGLPERVITMPREYSDEGLAAFFAAPSQSQLQNPQVADAYASSQAAARTAYVNSQTGLPDPTGGALNFNLRPNARTTPFFGIPFATQSGPYTNWFPTADLPAGSPVYIVTYRSQGQ